MATVSNTTRFIGMIRKSIVTLFLAVLSIGILIPSTVFAASAPTTLGYQGYIEYQDAPFTGSADFTFTIYSASSGGSSLWTETQSAVSVTDGYFSVSLGSHTPFLTSLDFSSAYYLEVTVNGTPLAPRQTLDAVPYAHVTYGVNTTTSAPSSPTNGMVYFDSTGAGTLYVYDATSGWNMLATSTVAGGQVINLATNVTGKLAIANGGTGTTSAPTYGKLLMGDGAGGYAFVATSSLGISGGSGLTSLNGLTGATQTFATSSDTNIGLSIVSTGTTHTLTPSWIGTLGIARGGTGIATTPTYGQLLMGNGSGGYALVATSSLGITGGGSGISSLNGLVGTTQTFATTSDTNIGISIVSSGSTHTYTPSWIGTLAAGRGGTGLSSATANQLLVGNASGTGFTQVATSSLGLLTTNVAEGSNQYYTDTRARAAISTTATGLTYTAGSGVLSLTSGYTIPTTASTTAWNNNTSPWIVNGNIVSYGAGNVGVGATSTPGAVFSIAGNSGATTPIFLVSTSTSAYATSTVFMIDPNGRVGIGSSSPSQVLSVNGLAYIGSATSGGSIIIDPVLRRMKSLEANGQNQWMLDNNFNGIGGAIGFAAPTGGTQAGIGATASAGTIALYTSGITSATERMRIDTTGRVGVGSTSPWGLMSVNLTGSTPPAFVVGSSTGTGFLVTSAGLAAFGTTSTAYASVVINNTLDVEGGQIRQGGASAYAGTDLGLYNHINAGLIRFQTNGGDFRWMADDTGSTNRMILTSAGTLSCTSGCTNAISDIRLKTNIQDLASSTSGLNAIMRLQPVSYQWKEALQGTTTQFGFIAQDVENIFPNLVGAFGTTSIKLADGSTQTIYDTKNLNYQGFLAPMVESIQQIARVSDAFRDNLISWLGSAENGIHDIYTNTSHQKTLCVGAPSSGETCITKQQLDSLLQAGGTTGSTPPPAPPVVEASTSTTTEEVTPPESDTEDAEPIPEETPTETPGTEETPAQDTPPAESGE